MKINITLFLILLIFVQATTMAQVQVSKEPRHKPVLENKYIRLLDVWLPSGDTTYFHIHSTPSLFIYLSNNQTASQVMGGEWTTTKAEAGTTWYRSFYPDSLVHRVANVDSNPFHVNDIEILSGFHPAQYTPLPYTILFENEKAAAFAVNDTTLKKDLMKDRGPVIAELVKGDGVIFHNQTTNASQQLSAGHYVYIPPGNPFYFTPGSGSFNMVLFEIK